MGSKQQVMRDCGSKRLRAGARQREANGGDTCRQQTCQHYAETLQLRRCAQEILSTGPDVARSQHALESGCATGLKRSGGARCRLSAQRQQSMAAGLIGRGGQGLRLSTCEQFVERQSGERQCSGCGDRDQRQPQQ